MPSIYEQKSGLYNGSGTKDLQNGNLVANVDFRQRYGTVATWLGLPFDSSLSSFIPVPCRAP